MSTIETTKMMMMIEDFLKDKLMMTDDYLVDEMMVMILITYQLIL